MLQVFSGSARELPKFGFSAINKTLVTHPVRISSAGIEGDQVGDLRHHGGKDRAILFYPLEHYSVLLNAFPRSNSLPAGVLGENFSGTNWPEHKVHFGDVFALGGIRLQVCQPRSPCFKLGLRVGDRRAPQYMQQYGLTGYFFRVLEAGVLEPDCRELELLERSAHEMSVATFLQWFFNDPLNEEKLYLMLTSKYLSEHWKYKLQKRLTMGAVEAWAKRLGYFDPKLLEF